MVDVKRIRPDLSFAVAEGKCKHDNVVGILRPDAVDFDDELDVGPYTCTGILVVLVLQ